MSSARTIDAMVIAQLVLFGLSSVGLAFWYSRDRKKPYAASDIAAKAARDRDQERKMHASISRQQQIQFITIAHASVAASMLWLWMGAPAFMPVAAMIPAVWALSSMVAEYYMIGEELPILQTAAFLIPLLQLNQNVLLNAMGAAMRIAYLYAACRYKKPTTDMQMLQFDAATQVLLAAAVFQNQNAALFFVSNLFYFVLLPIAVVSISWMRTNLTILPRNWSLNYVILTACVGVVCLVGPSVAINYTPFYSERPQIERIHIPSPLDDSDSWCAGLSNPNDAGTVSCGIGACYREFSKCIDGRYNSLCLPSYPRPEVCDCIDNDCNGVVDDGAVCDGYETDCTVCGLTESEPFLIKKLII